MTRRDFRAWMAAGGYSIATAARALGLSPRTVAYYRAGEVPIPEPVSKLCEVLSAVRVKT